MSTCCVTLNKFLNLSEPVSSCNTGWLLGVITCASMGRLCNWQIISMWILGVHGVKLPKYPQLRNREVIQLCYSLMRQYYKVFLKTWGKRLCFKFMCYVNIIERTTVRCKINRLVENFGRNTAS